MKNKILLLALLLAPLSIISAQEFQKPSEGKALVYFLRTSNLGSAINFKFFDNETYIGKFNGKNYVVKEFEAGKHLIWTKSENLDFMEADLAAGKTYLIHVKPKMGGFKAAVRLEPIKAEDTKLMAKIKKLLSKKEPREFNMKRAEKVKPFIEEYLERYKKKKESNTDKIKILTADMNYVQA